MTAHLLNPVDTIWWRTDRPENLMVIECLVRLEGPLDRARFTRVLGRRVVEEFPVFHQRPVASRVPGGLPRWRSVPAFRIEDHLHEVGLPDGSDDAAVQGYLGGFLGVPLDADRPPWEIHLIEGHARGTMLYVRLHHAMADGIALTRVLLSITDEVADADLDAAPTPPAPGPATGEQPGREPGRPVPSPGSVARGLRRALGLVPAAARTPAILGKLVLSRTPVTPLSGRVTRAKAVAWSEPVPLAQVKELARSTGTTVNDVLLAALAGALQRYQSERGARPRDLPTMIPVNLRPLDKPLPSRLGNRFAVVLLRLPSGLSSPGARLAETRRRMNRIKASPEPLVTFVLLHLIGLAGARAGRLLVRFFATKAIGVTTNVPGPAGERYLAGTRIDSLLGWVPGSGNQTLGTCIFTYAGSVHVGFKTDAVAIPDPERIVEGFRAELADMLAPHVADSRTASPPPLVTAGR